MPLTAHEQLMLELINRARLDPLGEAARIGIDLNEGLAAGTLTGEPRQVVAHNEMLYTAADEFSQFLLDNNIFTHVPSPDNTPFSRAAAAGYIQTGWMGESLSIRTFEGPGELTDTIVSQHYDLFGSEDHRQNLLNVNYEEIGIGQRSRDFTFDSGGSSFSANTSMVTQLLAQDTGNVFLSGVIYSDSDSDMFYSVGEGIADYEISAQSFHAQSQVAGGYALALGAATEVAVTLGSGEATMRVNADLSEGSGKIDVVNGSTVLSSVDLTVVSNVSKAVLLGAGDLSLTGANSADVLHGNIGENLLLGLDGSDYVHGMGGSDYVHGNSGDDTVDGGGGDDTVIGGPGDDRVLGGAGDDELTGGNGRDTLLGGGGDDLFFAQAGDDHVVGGDGIDSVHLGIGSDVYEGNGSGGDIVRGLAGHDTITGGSDGDLLMGHLGLDVISGRGGNDTIRAGIARDIISGGDGNDLLDAAPGWDVLNGGAGNDTLIGSLGNDQMTGGTGADTFVFTARSGWDMVTDYEDGIDILSITYPGRSFDQLVIRTDGDNTTVWYGSGGIILEDIAITQITEDDFLFS